MTEQEKINGWTFEETIKNTEKLMETEDNAYKWDALRHLRDFTEMYKEELEQYRALGLTPELIEAMQGHNIAMINDLAEYQALGTVRQVQDFIADWRKFRELGNLEELRVARDKQVAKKPFKTMDKNNPYYKYMPWCCPCCRETLYEDTEWGEQEFAYCTDCGQKLDWGNKSGS